MDSMAAAKPKAKRRGDKGQPWSTPALDFKGWAVPVPSQKTWVVGFPSHARTVASSAGRRSLTPCHTCCLGRVPKALLASNARTTREGCSSTRAVRVLWISLQPACRPTPYWQGPTASATESFKTVQAALAAKRLTTLPMATGLTPPPGFSRAMSLAPKLASSASAGHSPNRKSTTNLAAALWAGPSASRTPHCSKREPLGPGLDFLENFLIARSAL